MEKPKETKDRTLKTMQIRLAFSILVVVLTTSCRQNNTFERYTSIDDGWDKHEIVSYDFTINDTLQKQNLYIKLRTSEQYEYSNLYLIVDLKYPNGKVEKDTLEYQKPFSIVELIVHKKYKTKLIKSQRVDYDIALLRLDYPIVDEISGIYEKLLISNYCGR